MPKFDVTIRVHKKDFRHIDIEAETMDDAYTIARERTIRNISLVSVAPSPPVRPTAQPNARQMDGKNILETFFGPQKFR